jgi:hypothetical protein
MKKISLLFVVILLIFGNVNKSFAQKKKGQSTVTVGVGESIAGAIVSTYEKAVVAAINVFDPSINAKSTSIPAIFGSYDYSLTDIFSLGLAGSYQSWKVSIPAYNDGTTAYGASSLNITRTNFALRPLFHFGKNEDLDMYAGLRLGYTMWSTKITSTDPIVIGTGFGHGNAIAPAALFGLRYFFTKNIGANFEISLGAPYAVALGVNARF